MDTTEEYKLGPLPERLKTGITLRIGNTRQELEKVQTTLGGPGSDWVLGDDLPAGLWKFTFCGGKLQFVAAQRSRPAYRGGSPLLFGELRVGDRLDLEGRQLEVCGEQPSQAFLEGISAHFLGTRWVLAEGESTVGRDPENTVVLDDPAISRRHAAFVANRVRALSLKSETRLNGTLLDPGQEAQVHEGDLLNFGPHVFRFHQEEAPAPELHVQFLGSLRVVVGSREIAHEEWQGALVQHAFALLVLHREAPLSEERLLELLWGQEDVSRKRLYNIVSHLRGLLRPALIVRDARGYQLHPSLKVRHDLDDLQALLRNLETAADGRKALQLYRGKFLEGCLLPWAEIRRAKLEADLSQALARLAQALVHADPAGAQQVAQGILEVDPLCEGAYLALVAVQRAAGNEREAARFLELGRTQLERAGIFGSRLGKAGS